MGAGRSRIFSPAPHALRRSGSLPAPSPYRVQMTSISAAPAWSTTSEGRRVARYDKMHLFRFTAGDERYDETRTLEPGERPVALDSPFGRLALSVCYDVRFPELYRALGAFDVMFVPSAFTVPTGAAHWETLLRARAIENQAYVIAPAQGGTHAGGRRTYGHSMIVDPGARSSRVQRRRRGRRACRDRPSAHPRGPSITARECQPENELILDTAKTTLLAPFDLEAAKLERVFGTLAARNVDYADLYFQYSRSEGWSLEEGIVKSGSFNIDQGVGVRAVSGEKTAFAYSDEISFAALRGRGEGDCAPSPRPGRRGTSRPAPRRLPRRRSTRRIDPIASLASDAEGRAAGDARAQVPRARPARHAGDGEPRRRIRGGAGRARRRHARRRRAAAGAPVGAGDRRAERPARERHGGRRRALRLLALHRRGARRVRASRPCRRRSPTWRRARRRPAR